jgi:hypothetical protein
MRKEATVVGPMHWMGTKERDTVELCMLGSQCMANAAYAEPYPAAARSRMPSHKHHKNRNSHGYPLDIGHVWLLAIACHAKVVVCHTQFRYCLINF